ncbi:MAG: hypothetical protein J5697_02300 [Clostridia bacterium]|nr:hypothetical protein [Clostridia bacterium]
MRNRFSVVADTVFVLFAGFFVFLWLFYYLLPYPFSLLLSIVVSALIAVFFLAIVRKKNEKTAIEKADLKKYESVMLDLAVANKTEKLKFFCSLYKKIYENVKVLKGAVFIADKNLAVFPEFSLSPVGKETIVKAVGRFPAGAEILAENFTDEEQRFSRKFGGAVKLTVGTEAFALMKKHDLFPERKVTIPETRKKSFKLSFSFEKKKAVSFLLFGSLFVLFSFIAPVKVYYVISGLALLGLAVFIRLFGKRTA